MKTLSPLAAAILPLLTTPLTAVDVFRALPHATPERNVEAALDELTPDLVTCDEHEGVSYYYRRDRVAEMARTVTWNGRQRDAERARAAACRAAERGYIVAMDAADAERDAADPMAAIRVSK